ncbi:MAG: carbohydrate binding domain-containing protein [Chitinispirillaceae bacterium]
MKKTILLMLLSFSLSRAQTDRSEWFQFYLPWDDTSRNITNISSFLDAPAGKHGFLQVGDDGMFRFQNNSERVLFAGVVNVADACFPDTSVARAAAGRMAKFGINLVRIHLIDVDYDHGLFERSTVNTTDLDPKKMDRMDFFVNELKKRGIYVNFCIQSGRVFKEGDSPDYPVENKQSKYVTLFNDRLIELQKDYARKTLDHVNPYTGLAYKDDPAVAQIELTNENSLFLGWVSWGNSAIFGDVEDGIGPDYSAELDSLFNDWLREKYETDSSVAAAWQEVSISGEELITNQSFERNSSGWSQHIETSDGADGVISRDTTESYHGKASQKVMVKSRGTENWHIQFNTNTFSAQEGKSYRFSFYLKSDEVGPFQIELLKNAVWTWYGGEEFTSDTGWKRYEWFFTASETVVDSMRFNINFGRSSGTFWIDSASIKQVGLVGREDGELLAEGNYRRTRSSELGEFSSERVGDNARFYFDLEGKYISTMTSFLKDSLGIKVPVTFTNNYYGLASVYSQSRADYMDAHLYWDHPHYPNGWSDIDWTIKNKPMVKDPYGATINSLVLSKVDGKPLVLSEYNHPYPQSYQCEAPGLIYAYSGFHDLDGVIWHAYIDYHQRYDQQYQDLFFDVGMNPVVMTQMLLSVPFRSGRIDSAVETISASYTEETVFENTRIYKDRPVVNIEGKSDNTTGFLENSFAHGSFDAEQTGLTGDLSDPGMNIASSTGELEWDGNNGVFTVDNPYWHGAVGFLGGREISLSRMGISEVTTTNDEDFAAVHLISMDSLEIASSKRMLLLASARIENKGLEWNSSQTGLVNHGGDHILCEPVRGRVALKGAKDSIHVYALDPRGERMEKLEVNFSGDSAVFGLNSNTLWYEISNAGDPVNTAVPSKRSSGLDIRMPSGKNNRSVRLFLPRRGKVDITLYGIDGRKIRAVAKNRLFTAGEHAVDFLTKGTVGADAAYLVEVSYEGRTYTEKMISVGKNF